MPRLCLRLLPSLPLASPLPSLLLSSSLPLFRSSSSSSSLPPNYFNFPKKFVERQMRLGEDLGHHHRMINERPTELRVFGKDRPWTLEWAYENYPVEGMMPGEGHSHAYERAWSEMPLVEPIKDPVIFRGDRVEIQVGKDKGKVGVVRQVIEGRNWCYVEGLNCVYEYSDRQITQEERPLLVTTQVKLVDPVDERGCEVEWRFTEDGERVRVSTRSERILPIPEAAKATIDYVTPEHYVPGPKDTEPEVVVEVTYEPKLKTVEEDILESLGIVEERKRGKTYWY